MTPRERNTGAKHSIFNAGVIPDGVAALPPNGKKPANAGVGKAAVFSNHAPQIDQEAENRVTLWVMYTYARMAADRAPYSQVEPLVNWLADRLGVGVALDTIPAKKQPILDGPSPIEAVSAVKRDPVTLEPQAGIDPVTEMHEALAFVVTHWDNLDAHRLPGKGFKVYRAPGKPSDVQIPESQMGPYIVWKHDRLANRMVIAMRDLKTGEMCYVATKKDISEYMTKARAAA